MNLRTNGISKADDVSEVDRLRREQEIIQAKGVAQKRATQLVNETFGGLQQMGTDDTTREVAAQAQNIAYNAMNAIRETEREAMVVVNEDLGKARIADGHAQTAAANARLVSNVPDAVNDIHSGKEARKVQMSIEGEGEHQAGVRDTTTRNAQELQHKTNAVVQAVSAEAQSILNSTSL